MNLFDQPYKMEKQVKCPDCRKMIDWPIVNPAGPFCPLCHSLINVVRPSLEEIGEEQFKNLLKQGVLGVYPSDDLAFTKVGVRYDHDKLRWDLVPMHLLEGMVKVLMVGMKKYSAHNWRKGLHTTRISNSLQRHLNSYLAGEELDPESGLPHVDHILCNALFLKGQAVEHPEMDDRYRRPISGIGHWKPDEPLAREELNVLSAPEGEVAIRHEPWMPEPSLVQ